MLVKGEPDGSSFPNGGLRDTHEARGYTVWDPTSPCFITSHGTGTTLCVPSVFFSWHGHALDEKTPLLRSVDALEREAVSLLRVMGEHKHKTVHTDSGIEQEFFLVDREYYLRRPDIMQTGRTLQGAAPPKGQSLDDQYFGAFSDRFLRCMNDAEVAMWKLGIPQTTRHREVAPGQYEMAPVFAHANVAGDYNMLQMDVLTRTAEEHGLQVLFHEKPFAGLNGSGKHNNWSVGTNLIGTLFDPGHQPAQNLLFMTFLAATVRAVHLHGDVLRSAMGGASNDHRLGANEAPPAIMSVFLGSDVTAAVNEFVGEDVVKASNAKGSGDLGVGCLPEFTIDPTDRNRTSPFAFTGNKFEFRAVGSTHNPARSNTYLNTAMADALKHISATLSDRIGSRKLGKAELAAETAAVVRDVFKQHAAAVFDGDNYSKAWEEEAERRGLQNLRNTVDSIAAFDSEKNYALFEKHGVLSRAELAARVNVVTEEYVTKILTEVDSFTAIARTMVYPAAFEMQTKVAGAVIAAKSAGIETGSGQHAHLDSLTATLNSLIATTDALNDAAAKVHEAGSLFDEAKLCQSTLLPLMEDARAHADKLEGLCDADLWPMPNYHEMLFHQA